MADIVWEIEIDGSEGLTALTDLDQAVNQWMAKLGAADQLTKQLAADIATHFDGVTAAERQARIEAESWAEETAAAARQTADQLKELDAIIQEAASVTALPVEKSLSQLSREIDATKARMMQLRAELLAGNISGETAMRGLNREQKKLTELTQQQGGVNRSTIFQAIALYDMAKSALMGWVNAGLAGTSEAALMQTQFQLIAREVAGVFKPVIDAANNALSSIRNTLAGMTGDTQETIRNIIGATAAFAGVLTIAPKVASSIGAISNALSVAASANPFTVVAAGLAAVLVGTEAGREALGTIAETFGAIADAVTPILEVVGDLVSLFADILAPTLKIIAEIFKAVILPIFEVLKPIFELIAFVIKGISSAIGALARFLGLKKDDADSKKSKSAVSQAGGGVEDIESAYKRIQSAALKTDVAQMTRERMERHLAMIERHTRPTLASSTAVTA